jgi:glycosyltransferase involved in cell wall biosynthesis
MRIGFDAKRIFYNRSGLGNYSRDIIRSLQTFYPEHEYYLYTPSLKGSIPFNVPEGVQVSLPNRSKGKLMQAYWRSVQLTKRLNADGIEIFHGLSNELPRNIKKTRIKSVVTIHDLIFLRHPEWYKPIDRNIYRAKFRYSCKISDTIIAISEQTKNDIIEFFGVDEHKIQVVYQSCNNLFKTLATEGDKNSIRKKYALPGEYLLYVGTIEERKNLLNILKAFKTGNINIPLVVVGRKTRYFTEIKHFIETERIKNIHFLNEISVEDLPAMYQMAELFIYPSVFEGFGIPILEALYSRVPVITSQGGCFREAGGPSSVYVNPSDPEEISEAIQYIINREKLQAEMKEIGYRHALQFSDENIARDLMNIYEKLVYGS